MNTRLISTRRKVGVKFLENQILFSANLFVICDRSFKIIVLLTLKTQYMQTKGA